MTGWKFGLAYFILLALITRTQAFSWNDAARMATIESLVNRQTFVIDDSPFAQPLGSGVAPGASTGDKVLIRGHFYSNKLPVMEVAGAGVFFLLHHVFGLELGTAPNLAYYLLTLLMVGGSSALMVVLLDRWCRWKGFDRVDRVIAVAGLAVATLVLPYSTIFNNHAPGGALLMLGVALLMPTAAWTDRRALWAGMAIGFSATLDPPPGGIFSIVFLVYIVARHGFRTAGLFVAGLVPPLVIQVGLQLAISGDVLPVIFHREYMNFPGSRWTVGTYSGQFHLQSIGGGLRYAYHSLFGIHGFFSYSPFLLWGLAGLVLTAWSGSREERGHARTTLVAGVGAAAYLILFATDYGGQAYGDRYFVPLAGMMVLFVPRGLWSNAGRWQRGLLVVALAVSISIATIGVVINPWTASTLSESVDMIRADGVWWTVRHVGVLELYRHH